MNSSTIVTTVYSKKNMRDTYCEICGSNLWFCRTPPYGTARPSVLFPCTWKKSDGKDAFAHLGEILIAQLFKCTIENKQIFLCASEESHRIQKVKCNSEERKRIFIDAIIVNIRTSNLGNALNITEKLKSLRKQFKQRTQISRPSSYEALKAFEGLDIHKAFAWMRDTPASESIDDEKTSINSYPNRKSDEELYTDWDGSYIDWDDA